MAMKGKSGSNEEQFAITQKNLDRKGKTNKKARRNSMAGKYMTTEGQRLKDEAIAYAKEHFRKGRRTLAKQAVIANEHN